MTKNKNLKFRYGESNNRGKMQMHYLEVKRIVAMNSFFDEKLHRK